jgi:hypothetical protein
MNSAKTLILTILTLATISLRAGDKEDYEWWNNQHNWDGCTHWTRYLNASAAYWGPNALPVPVMNEALISKQFSFEFRPETHLSKGDKTFDLYTSLKIPLAERVDFEVFIVPVEVFEMDTATRNERYVRHIDASGTAGGDFWFGTNFTVLKENKRRPQITASAYFKTASGTGLDYARYTDAPGYYLSFSAGKDFTFNKHNDRTLRLFAQSGFYAYQTWDFLHNQNDCVIYGIGAKYTLPAFWLRAAFAGYIGYFNKGDRPAVLRLQAGTRFKHVNFALKYQAGVHDFKYHSIGLSLILSFGDIDKNHNEK